jgi:arylformamidase
MPEAIYLHYTKAELDRNFDQRGWAPNALEVIARYTTRSRETRARLECRSDIPYGSTPDEVLDVFPAATAGAPVQIFVHGGAWINFSKDDFSFPAEVFVAEGMHTVVVNFANLPKVRLPEMVAQVRRSIAWTYENAASFGGSRERIYLSAHSSGAHLSALALQTDWAAYDLPQDIVKAATCVSGPYDLEPVMLSARSSYVKLTGEEPHEFSPIRHVHRLKCPILAAHAQFDTDEFRRQSCEFAAALGRAGKLSGTMCVPGLNHFELMETMGDRDSTLARAILDQMRD